MSTELSEEVNNYIAFINAQIEMKRGEMLSSIWHLKNRNKMLTDPTADYKISGYETLSDKQRSFDSEETDVSEALMDDIIHWANKIKNSRQQIGDLVRMKLKLFGDCDFPGGSVLIELIEKQKA